MDLQTTYLGFKLPHPLMPGSSPLTEDLDSVKRLEDAGAAAIVLHSLFEEQLAAEQLAAHRSLDGYSNSFAEALTYFPEPEKYRLGPDEYLERIRKIKAAVSVPVIASLNGASDRGWLAHAKLLAEAGADAIELNVYHIPTDAAETSEKMTSSLVRMVQAVKGSVKIPVAVKLSPFYTSLPELAAKLDAVGVEGMVLFNRFYQPDFDLETLDVSRDLRLSDSGDLLLRLRWLAILSPKVRASLAVTGGVHTGGDAIKAVMAGAHAVQMVSAVLEKGPEVLASVRDEMARWLEKHEYESLEQARGSLNLSRCPSPTAYERGNYVQILASWHPAVGSKGHESKK